MLFAKYSLYCALYVVFASSVAYAARPITVTSEQILNFATVIKPTSGNVKVVVRKNSTLGAGTTAIVLDTAQISAGKHRITGGNNNTIQVSFVECASNSSLNLKLKKFKARFSGVNFTDSAVGLDPPTKNGKILKYGATLVVRSTSLAGDQSPCYDITVNYD